jgi:chromosome segregation ATPase
MSTTTGYSQDEVDRLNEQINEMRSKVNDLENNVTAAQQTNEALQNELNNCRKNAEMNKGNQLDYTMEPVVSFRQNYALLEKSQFSNLENIANFMKMNMAFVEFGKLKMVNFAFLSMG